MNDVSRTLYIPLYGKALVSRRGVILRDADAERIWDAAGFELRGKARSRWLAYRMAMRARVFDMWIQPQLREGATVLHIGCGLDSRAQRVERRGCAWYDIDMPEVIEERRRFFDEDDGYHMVGADVRDSEWLDALPQGESAVVMLEGVVMYLSRPELTGLLRAIGQRYESVSVLMDCYTGLGARLSAWGNPIRTVGDAQVYGLDDAHELAQAAGMELLAELDMAPAEMSGQLRGMERIVFRRVFASAFARRLQRMYMLDKRPGA